MCFVQVNVRRMENSKPAHPSSPLSPWCLWLQTSLLYKFLLVPMRMERESSAISPGRERLIVPISTGAPGGRLRGQSRGD